MIDQRTIQKATDYLNEINHLLSIRSNITVKEIDTIAKRLHCANDLFYFAVSCGYFRRIDRGVYLTNVTKFEPFHSRKVIESRHAKFSPKSHKKSLRIKRNQEGRPLIKKVLPEGVHRYDVRQLTQTEIDAKDKEKQLQVQRKTSKKTISFFWGLFKMTY